MTAPARSASTLRRVLRPAAWTVWQAIVDHARPDGDRVVAIVSVRSLADELGLAKDTVSAAIRRLAAHGLIERQPQPHANARFTFGRYVLHPIEAPLPHNLVDPALSPVTPLDDPPCPDSPLGTAASQLSLLVDPS